LGGECLEI